MPNILTDGFLIDANAAHVAALNYAQLDFALQNACAAAIATAALTGVFTCTVSVSAYSASNYNLVQRMIKRLVDLGYTATLATSTLTINW